MIFAKKWSYNLLAPSPRYTVDPQNITFKMKNTRATWWQTVKLVKVASLVNLGENVSR